MPVLKNGQVISVCESIDPDVSSVSVNPDGTIVTPSHNTKCQVNLLVYALGTDIVDFSIGEPTRKINPATGRAHLLEPRDLRNVRKKSGGYLAVQASNSPQHYSIFLNPGRSYGLWVLQASGLESYELLRISPRCENSITDFDVEAWTDQYMVSGTWLTMPRISTKTRYRN